MKRPLYLQVRSSLEAQELIALATVIEGPGRGNQLVVWPAGQTRGDLGGPRLNQRVAVHAQQAMRGRFSKRGTFDSEGSEVEVFIEPLSPSERMIVVGAVHVAAPLCDFARHLGYRTVVVDPREAFASAERFAGADEISREWPDVALKRLKLNESTYVVLLSHDPKLDLAALSVALRSPAPYVGALGSRKTHAKRIEALREAGFDESDIERIHAPVGLDIGGRKAEEIALSVIAEITAVKHGKRRQLGSGLARPGKTGSPAA